MRHPGRPVFSVDAKGKPRYKLSSRGELYKRARMAHPDWSQRACAIEAGAPEKHAKTSANHWEHHPDVEEAINLHARRELAAAGASLERTLRELARIGYSDLRNVVAWDADGVKLRASSDLTEDEAAGVAEVSEVLGKEGVRGVRVKMHSKPEALVAMLRYYAPEKPQAPPPPPLIGQVNLNVILANPESRRALEAVVRVLEGQSSGNSGQVVAGTVAES